MLDVAFTREGRIAIGKFRRENMEVFKPFLDAVPGDMRDALMYTGVFVSEGGMLARRVHYANSDRLASQSLAVELGYPGLPVTLHQPFMRAIQTNLDKLNDARAAVLYARSMGS